MLDQAIDKIKTEKAQHANDPYVQVIGDFLLRQLEVTPGAAAQIMTEGKTIVKSVDAMVPAAQKRAKNNRAVLTGEEGLSIVLKYFGIDAGAGIQLAAAPAPVPLPEKVAQFNIRLEDLL